MWQTKPKTKKQFAKKQIHPCVAREAEAVRELSKQILVLKTLEALVRICSRRFVNILLWLSRTFQVRLTNWYCGYSTDRSPLNWCAVWQMVVGGVELNIQEINKTFILELKKYCVKTCEVRTEWCYILNIGLKFVWLQKVSRLLLNQFMTSVQYRRISLFLTVG